MTTYEKILERLKAEDHLWLITGVAGFIGSNLLETLLKNNQRVIGLDNFSTGFQHNLNEVREAVGGEQWQRFRFIKGDICNIEECKIACEGVDYVLHEAAIGSVPRSIEDPIATNQVNISGFLNMLVASRDAKVKRFVFAASSSTYGDHPGLPKIEEAIGRPLSPYAVTKYVNELYADVFLRAYNLQYVGLRYFNVFGPRQDPDGAYAAVIPLWINSILKNEVVSINGDGETTRDFCYIENVVQANILAAICLDENSSNEIYNVANGARITLNELYINLKNIIEKNDPNIRHTNLKYRDFRNGDVRHSQASIEKISKKLKYYPSHNVTTGLDLTIKWFLKK